MQAKSIGAATPLVSIVAVCYNHSRFVAECLENIRHQTYKKTELIIIDDCSTDNSVDVIQNWIESNEVKCVFIRHVKNMGVCKTLNDALSYATGKYVSITATDDVWLLDKIENQVRKLESLPDDVAVVYSKALGIDENGKLIPGRVVGGDLEGDIFARLIKGNIIPAIATLVRKSCYDEVGLYDEKLCYEDWDMWLRISQHYNFAFSPIISAKYRTVSTSLTATVLNSPNEQKLKTNFRIYSKCLSSNKISSDERRWIVQELAQLSEEMYKIGCRRRNSYLWRILVKAGNFRMLCMFVFSASAVSYKRFAAFSAWLYALNERLLVRQLTAALPPGEDFILIDDYQFGRDVVAGCRAVRMLEQDGEFWGNPGDDGAAISEVERLRKAGAGFLVFTWLGFWWLDHYAGLHRYLRATFRCVVDNNRLIVFDLRKESLLKARSAGNYKESVESGFSK